MKFNYGWVIVACTLIIFISLGTLFGTFGVFLEPLAEQFGWERGALSAASSISTLLGGFVAIFTGKLSDKYGPRILATVAGILAGTLLLFMSQINSLWQVYLLWGFLGAIAMGCCTIPLSSTIPKWFNGKRGLAVTLGIIGMAAGGALWPVLSQWLIDSYDWQQSYTIMGVVAFTGITISAQFLKRSPQQIKQEVPYNNPDINNTAEQEITSKGLYLNQAIKAPRFWLLCLILFFHNFYIMLIIVHIVPYAIDIGISSTTAASVLSTFVLISLMAQLAAGFVVDKIGAVKLMILSLIMVVISYSVLPFTSSIGLLFLFAVLLGTTGEMNTLQTLVSVELFGTKDIGIILAVVCFFGTVGGALGPYFAGSVFDIMGNYSMAFLTCTVIGVVNFILGLLLFKITQVKK